MPDSQRGYAPWCAAWQRATVLQGKSTLYETTVAPGPFAINDLYATNHAGDLTVVVTEADSSVSTLHRPFAAVPESIRPGQSRYSAIVGRSRYVGDNDLFSELTWQHSLTNALTFNVDRQLADGYQAMMLGSVYSSELGAFGMDTTYSPACRTARLRLDAPSLLQPNLQPRRTPPYPSPAVTPPKASAISATCSAVARRRHRPTLAIRLLPPAFRVSRWPSIRSMGAFGSLTSSARPRTTAISAAATISSSWAGEKTFGNGVILNLRHPHPQLGYSSGDYPRLRAVG